MKICSTIEDLLGSQNTFSLSSVNNDNREVEFNDLLILRISDFTYRKIQIVIKTAFKALNHAVESYWLFLGNKCVEDIIIPYQHVSHAFVEVDAMKILDLKNIIRESKMNILGWGHSHADFGVFFSETDWRNQERIFNETANYAIVKRKKNKLINKSIIKYSYGSTFNIHGEKFVQFTWQEPNKKIQHLLAKIEIIHNKNNENFNYFSYEKEIQKYFSK